MWKIIFPQGLQVAHTASVNISLTWTIHIALLDTTELRFVVPKIFHEICEEKIWKNTFSNKKLH